MLVIVDSVQYTLIVRKKSKNGKPTLRIGKTNPNRTVILPPNLASQSETAQEKIMMIISFGLQLAINAETGLRPLLLVIGSLKMILVYLI